MKEFFSLLFSWDIKGLFWTPSENVILQMFRYVFVGGCAFVVDAGSLWFMTAVGINEYLATAVAFVLGLVFNYVLSKKLVFTKEESRASGVLEFLVYGIIGVIGLAITEGLMFVGLEWLHWHVMVVKVLAAAIVLVWNFAARKLLLYSKTESK